GVRFAQAINDRTEIESLTDGFPAAVILKPRDVIREIDGQTVSSRISADGSWSTVRALIISHDPGDSVRIVVDRAGVKTPLTVPLGDFTRLGQSAVATSVELRAAWQHRLRRRLEAAGAGAAAGPLGVSALIDATALRGGHIDMSGRPADPMDQGFVKRAAVGDTPSVAPGATPDKARRASTDATVGAGFAQPFNRANGFGGLAAPVLDRQELARLSDAELKDERRRLMAEAQMFSIFLDQQKDFGGRAPVREFVDLLNRTRQQLDAVTGEISRRREARQPKPAEPPAPPTRAPADDQKPDQKADKP
ncbi:MAG: hypothetical protein K2Q09_04860, partial [Phycisphaerales bacterium]|nr:hypothetical protein [Phycisphaerales bacterium]